MPTDSPTRLLFVTQTCAGFLAFMAVLNDYGYAWSTLPGLGINWSNYPMVSPGCAPPPSS